MRARGACQEPKARKFLHAERPAAPPDDIPWSRSTTVAWSQRPTQQEVWVAGERSLRRRGASLVTQGFDRIEARGALRGVEAEDDADESAEAKGQGDDAGADEHRPAELGGEAPGREQAQHRA